MKHTEATNVYITVGELPSIYQLVINDNGLITETEWLESFERNKQKALNALSQKDTPEILVAVFNHLYTLRNQIIHGGATFNSTVNRSQLKDACTILFTIIPEMLLVMLNHPNDKTWGKPFYPVVKS